MLDQSSSPSKGERVTTPPLKSTLNFFNQGIKMLLGDSPMENGNSKVFSKVISKSNVRQSTKSPSSKSGDILRNKELRFVQVDSLSRHLTLLVKDFHHSFTSIKAILTKQN